MNMEQEIKKTFSYDFDGKVIEFETALDRADAITAYYKLHPKMSNKQGFWC